MIAKIFSWDPPLYVVLPFLAVVLAVTPLLYGGPVLTRYNVLFFCVAAAGATVRTLRTTSRFRENVTWRSWRLVEGLVVWLVGVGALGVAWFTWGRKSPRVS